jgi:hypothetical protein
VGAGKLEILIGALIPTAFWAAVAVLLNGSPINIKDYAGPAATVIAAASAGWGAYRLGQAQISVAERNWRTANEKVVLELLERRLATYDGIRDVIGEVARSGNAPDAQHMNQLGLAYTTLADPNCADRGKWAQVRSSAFRSVTRFARNDAIFGPYLRAQQRLD